MNPLNSQQISGTWATLLLPIDSHDGIEFSRLEEELEYLLCSGVDGIYTNGTAGEFYAQSEDEFDRVHTLLAEKCEKARMPFQIGVGHMSAQISKARLRRAVQLAPSAVQVILPDWYPVSDDEAIAFLKSMSDLAGPIGLVLYNPPHAKRVLDPAAFRKLCKAIPGLVGVKVADGDKAWYASMRRYMPNVSLFVPGHHLATGIQQGASGAYSNVACLHPAGAKRWNESIKSDPAEALRLEKRLAGFLDNYILPFREQQHYSNQALDKLLAAIGGWARIGTRLRWPYRGVSESEARRLQPIAKKLLPEFF